jgi:hypothetical protein
MLLYAERETERREREKERLTLGGWSAHEMVERKKKRNILIFLGSKRKKK